MKHTNKILLNGDSCAFFYQYIAERFQPEGGPYSAHVVHRLVGELAASGVDTFIINGNTQRSWYPSRSLPRITEGYMRGDKDFFRSHIPNTGFKTVDEIDAFLEKSVHFLNRYLDLEEAGGDWLRETTIACRSNGISPWISIRMNDTHGADALESFFNCPLFRDPVMRTNMHPVNLLDPRPRRREGLNYLRPEVREYMLSMIREPVLEYDFDGLELDWMRDPTCVTPPACRRDVETITDFFRQVRQIADTRARMTGKPCPISLRAPGSLNLLLDIGIDVRTLVREGAIDCFAPCNFYQTAWDMPFDELRRELGDRVTLFGSVNSAPNWFRCGNSKDKAGSGYRDIGLDFAGEMPQDSSRLARTASSSSTAFMAATKAPGSFGTSPIWRD